MILIPLLLIAQAVFGGKVDLVPISSTPVYLVEENCEGTGTPAGWTDATSPNWDYTTTILDGAQSWGGTAGANSYTTFSGETTVEAYAMLRINAYPGVLSSYLSLRTSAAGALVIFRINTAGQVTCYANGSDSSATVTTFSTNTLYHVWIRFVESGTCSVAFSTDGVRPTSGDNYVSKTGGSGTAERVYINGPSTSGSLASIYDRIRVLDGTIGNSP